MDPVIELVNVVVRYDAKRALDGLSLRVHPGEIFGFLGPNGAGKSTTIKTILGLILPDSGTVRLHGLPASDVRARAAVGFMPEETAYYKFLTPLELLDFYGKLFGMPRRERRERAKALLAQVGLDGPVQRRCLSTFSKGMAQKVSLAQALINDPRTLVLDEPTSGLDPLARADLHRLLDSLRREGRTIFFSSHELSEVELLCDSVAVVCEGRVVRSGAMKELVGAAAGSSLERFFIRTVKENARS